MGRVRGGLWQFPANADLDRIASGAVRDDDDYRGHWVRASALPTGPIGDAATVPGDAATVPGDIGHTEHVCTARNSAGPLC